MGGRLVVAGPCFRRSLDNQAFGSSGNGFRVPRKAVSSPISQGKPTINMGPALNVSPCRAFKLRPVLPQASANSHQFASSWLPRTKSMFRQGNLLRKSAHSSKVNRSSTPPKTLRCSSFAGIGENGSRKPQDSPPSLDCNYFHFTPAICHDGSMVGARTRWSGSRTGISAPLRRRSPDDVQSVENSALNP